MRGHALVESLRRGVRVKSRHCLFVDRQHPPRKDRRANFRGPVGTRIRLADESDAEQILRIYRPYVIETWITFELEPPSVEEMRQRVRDTLACAPWLVSERAGEITGYGGSSACGSFRVCPRPRGGLRVRSRPLIGTAPSRGAKCCFGGNGSGSSARPFLIGLIVPGRFRPMVEKPRVVQFPDGLEVLAYESPRGLRVDSWKVFNVEGNTLIEEQLDDPSPKLRAKRFSSVQKLRRAVLGSYALTAEAARIISSMTTESRDPDPAMNPAGRSERPPVQR